MRLPLAAALTLLAAAPARAEKVTARLLSAAASAAPGAAFDAGLRLTMRDGWHTYWVNPGDSGMATRLTWTLPAGWTAGPLEWPAPQRLAAPPLASFGYKEEVVLPFRLMPPASTRPGTTAHLRATADWLECKEICLPGQARLSLEVPVARRATIAPSGARALEKARASLPSPDTQTVSAADWDGSHLLLRLRGRFPRAEFFPLENGHFENAAAPVAVGPVETELSLSLAPGAAVPTTLSGVLTRPGLAPVSVSVPVRAGGALARSLVLAFLGGLLLNLMPCVFPVISLKVLGLLDRGRGAAGARLHAGAYAAGVVFSFELLAGSLVAARAAGAALGWGFQLQSAPVVAALALFFFFLGLNLWGVFEVGGRLMGLGAKASRGEGLWGSLASGAFAVVVAAPCTAPFMGAALGWALTRPFAETAAVFASLGLGTAAPYALLACWPALLKRLPRPGAWMLTLKKALAAPMFATAAWLLWILYQLLASSPAASGDWRAWSPQAAAQARAEGRTVFVDFTAAWCLTCQVNERVTLANPQVRAALARADVAAFKADWTARDPRIAAELAGYGRSGVPLYVVNPRGGQTVLLPELLTPRLVLDALGPAPEPGEKP